ncbi:MAG: 3-phosphoshikimate 1-carboxyvinyltransferase [Bacteriovoracaceae bacterium]|nr:3-phosphoshikimate 1-carboxyvinyltransferase [Bacteriovoracaceae bacterium]
MKTISLAGDKSISHRLLLLSALSSGTSVLENLNTGEDVLSTLNCLKQLGVNIEQHAGKTTVYGIGKIWKASTNPLDCGNSGTTLRLLTAILAAMPFESILTGDASILTRPMKRLQTPLQKMGAQIFLQNENFAPVNIKGKKLKDIEYSLSVASGQIKSALMFAALVAKTKIKLTGSLQGRDHGERLFPHFGIPVVTNTQTIEMDGDFEVQSQNFFVAGDISSSAFLLAATALFPNTQLKIEKVGLNPTRTGFLSVLKKMGCDIHIKIECETPEPWGSIEIKSPHELQAITITPQEIPSLIDEIPLVALLGIFAKGETHVSGAKELRVKESDRLHHICFNFKKLGIDIEEREDGFKIYGIKKWERQEVILPSDHRLIMMFKILEMKLGYKISKESQEFRISYPAFEKDMASLFLNS